MEQRRRSAHNFKVSLKLKEVMQNKTQTKIFDKESEKPVKLTTKPLKNIANYLPKPVKPALKLNETNKFSCHPIMKACETFNKENLIRNESFYRRKPSIEKSKLREKSNCSFQKTPTQRSHSRISSMCDPRSFIKEDVQGLSSKSRKYFNNYKSPLTRHTPIMKERRRRTDSLFVGDTTSILSTKKKPIFHQKQLSLSRKSSFTSCVTKQPLEDRVKQTSLLKKHQPDNATEFQPSFTFQQVDLSCLEEKLELEKPDLRSADNFSLDFPQEEKDAFIPREFPPMTDSPDLHVPSAGYLSLFAESTGMITLQMRAVLLNWITEITELFMFKREVFYMAVNLLDRYLESIFLNVSKDKFQLVGMSCLYIASKFEESKYKHVDDFLDLAKNIYTKEELFSVELDILNAVRFKLVTSSLISVADLLSFNWDNFVETSLLSNRNFWFRQPSKESYQHYCKLSQLLDALLYDPEHYVYSQLQLAASCMYVILMETSGAYCKSYIEEVFPQRSCYLLDHDQEINRVFGKFLEYYTPFQLEELLPTVQFCAQFYGLAFTFESHAALKLRIDSILNSTIDDLLSYFKVNFDSYRVYMTLKDFEC